MSLKIDFHVHSNASNDGLMSLEEIANAAALKGLDGVAVCDHNKYAFDEVKKINNIYLIPGCEISTEGAHILALFCSSFAALTELGKGGLPSSDDAIKAIEKAGGLSVIAHPFDHEWDEKSIRLLPDCVETENARAWMRVPDANESAKEYAVRKALICLGGSDAHCIEEVGNAYTIVECEHMAEIKDAVMSGKTTAVFVKRTKRIYKAKSQLLKYKKENKALKGYIYYAYSLILSALGR